MYGYLTELGLISGSDFYEQYSYRNYILDFAFIHSRNPFRGLDLETDGIMWHSSPDQRKKDGYRTYKLLKGGWQIERVGESFTLSVVESILKKHEIL
jgi:very-short-patch-repair endonuclease